MAEQGLVVVKDNFFVRITRTLKRFFFNGKIKKIINQEEISNIPAVKIDFINQDTDFVQEEILNARRAFRKYVINNKKNIAEDIFLYILKKLQENETKIKEIIEINSDSISYEDIISLVEKATESIDEKEAEKTAKRMQEGKFDLEDFLSTMKQMKKLGPLENLLKLIPGASKMGLNNIKIDPKQMAHIEAIVLSMTPKERRNPDIIKASRKTRIAQGSGTSVQEVNKLLTQFEQMKKMMKQMSNGNMKLPF